MKVEGVTAFLLVLFRHSLETEKIKETARALQPLPVTLKRFRAGLSKSVSWLDDQAIVVQFTAR